MSEDEMRKLLFGDTEAREDYEDAVKRNGAPRPVKPEPGLLERFEDLEKEVEELHRDLWGSRGRHRWFYEIHEDKPPDRWEIHAAGRAVWIDWHMRKESYQSTPRERIKYWWINLPARVQNLKYRIFSIRPKYAKTCWGCAGKGSYDAGVLGGDIPCHECGGSGKK